MAERLGKLVKEGFGTGIGVGLKHTPKLPVRIIGGGFQCGLDLRWMVGIIVDDSYSVHLAFILKAPVCSMKCIQSGLNLRKADAKLQSGGDSSQGVGYIVDSGNTQGNGAKLGSFINSGKGRTAGFV